MMTAIGNASALPRYGRGASPAESIFLRLPDPSSMAAVGDASAFGSGASVNFPTADRPFLRGPIHHRWLRMATPLHLASVRVRSFPRRTDLSLPARLVIDDCGWRRSCSSALTLA